MNTQIKTDPNAFKFGDIEADLEDGQLTITEVGENECVVLNDEEARALLTWLSRTLPAKPLKGWGYSG